MAPHSSTLAWKIPWTEEPGGLQSMGSLRVGHDWVTSLSLFIFMLWLEWVAYPFSSGSSWPRNWTRVSCIAGRFFTNGTIREALIWGWRVKISVQWKMSLYISEHHSRMWPSLVQNVYPSLYLAPVFEVWVKSLPLIEKAQGQLSGKQILDR